MAEYESFEVRAVAKYVPISAQKVRLVIDQVRGMRAEDALAVLAYMPQRAALLVTKTIASALANADENFGFDRSDMVISYIAADEGPTRRHGRFGARGRFKPILRRSSHITVVLIEEEVS